MNPKNYDDIINLPHYEPKLHGRMTHKSRAAQFAPFAALRGYDEAIVDKQKQSLPANKSQKF